MGRRRMNVKIASLLAIALVLIGGIILLLHSLEEKQPPNEFNKISELLNNPENFENENVKIKGKITDIDVIFYIEDDTEKIYLIDYSRKEGFPYGAEDNVVVSGVSRYLPVLSGPPYFWVENVGERELPDLVEIKAIFENWKELVGRRITISGMITDLQINCYVSDNTGEMYCKSGDIYGGKCSERLPHKVGENVVIEGVFVIHRNVLGKLYPRIHMQKIERAR
jgi:mRNA-degrading endonuclease RelE of RelBE toxin-antitoxin system